jgi:hypothetical protein
MLEEVHRTRQIQGSRADQRHGLFTALQIANRQGDAAAERWLREHEQLPFHPPAQCPMPNNAAA